MLNYGNDYTSKLTYPIKLHNSTIDNKNSLAMSDAALNKRWKNLEDYISRKNTKDRDDALSHASQYIET